MAAIDSAIPAIFSSLGRWILKFNGLMVDGSGNTSLLQYVVDVLAVLTGLALSAAVFRVLIPAFSASRAYPSFGYYSREGRNGGMPTLGNNRPMFGYKGHPPRGYKHYVKSPKSINGLNAAGKVTYKPSPWKPPTLMGSIRKNGFTSGVIGYRKYRKGVEEAKQRDAEKPVEPPPKEEGGE